MPDDITYFVEMAAAMIAQDADRDAAYDEIDRAVNVEFDVPRELRALPWIGNRKFPTTAFSDADHAAVRSFATKRPQLTIFPVVDNVAFYDMTEKIETAIEWELERLNRPGTKTVLWQAVESAMRYCSVAIQTEYLPYVFKDRDKDPRVKALLRQSKFNWHVHHPRTVHVRESKYGIEAVLKATQVTAQELIDEFGEENEGIQVLLADFEKKDRASKITAMYNYFDLFTWDKRVQWAVPAESSTVEAGSSDIIFRNEEHGMPFIPWVVIDNKDPIMLPAIKAGLYDNANILNTIAFAKAVDMAAHPDMWIQTLDGTLRNVTVDNTNPSQPIVTDKTASVAQLRPPQIDPQLVTMQQEAKSEIFRSTVAQVLADISNIGSTATFSTVNAMLEAAVTQLALGQNAAEQGLTLAVYQMFQWIEFSGIPLIAYRAPGRAGKNKAGQENQAGQEILVQANYDGEDPDIASFDLDFLYLEMKLQATSITDKQAQLTNEVMMVERLGKSRRAAMEDLGQKNYDADFNVRGEEDLALATITAEATRIQMAPQMEAQAAQQQADQAAQQGKDAQNMANDMRGTMAETMQGTDNRGGGSTPMAATPGSNFEQMTGQTRSGQGMA